MSMNYEMNASDTKSALLYGAKVAHIDKTYMPYDARAAKQSKRKNIHIVKTHKDNNILFDNIII